MGTARVCLRVVDKANRPLSTKYTLNDERIALIHSLQDGQLPAILVQSIDQWDLGLFEHIFALIAS